MTCNFNKQFHFVIYPEKRVSLALALRSTSFCPDCDIFKLFLCKAKKMAPLAVLLDFSRRWSQYPQQLTRFKGFNLTHKGLQGSLSIMIEILTWLHRYLII